MGGNPDGSRIPEQQRLVEAIVDEGGPQMAGSPVRRGSFCGSLLLVFVFVAINIAITILSLSLLAANHIVPAGSLAFHVQPAVCRETEDDGQIEEYDGDQSHAGCQVDGGNIRNVQNGEHGGVDHARHADGDDDFLHGSSEVLLGVSSLLLQGQEDDVHVVNTQAQHHERQCPSDRDVDLDAAHQTEADGGKESQDDERHPDGGDQDSGFHHVAVQQEKGREESKQYDGDGHKGSVVEGDFLQQSARCSHHALVIVEANELDFACRAVVPIG
mmetsp:Transcript_10004/g.28429  ORF Transcript_10004/g.28429 Transcript_10004/m.28429 type:complete len:272 (+) Transcript_10004:1674-2489(+)